MSGEDRDRSSSIPSKKARRRKTSNRFTETSDSGTTVIDRAHQATVLFGGAPGAVLSRCLVEEEFGERARF
jgi:hypothetical protein